MNTPINAKDFGLAGNGIDDDTNAFRDMLGESQLQRRAIYLPTGEYLITDEVVLSADNPVVILGDSQNASKLLFDGCPGLGFNFYQHGIQQPVGLTMRGVALAARGACGNALQISYGDPEITNDHYRGAVVLRDVAIESNDLGHWNDGITLRSVWNATLDNVYASGNPCGGVWNNMAGAGLRLEGMCVNTHVSNSRFNFWATGLYAHAIEHNHEGIFCANNSMVAVKRGVWIKGNPAIAHAPRISSFAWQGGLIEIRAKGVVGGSAALHLEHVWTALINGAQMLGDTVVADPENAYGVIPQDCHGVVVGGCDINGFTNGVLTTGKCVGVSVCGNTITNVPTQLVFGAETRRSVYSNNVLINNGWHTLDLNESANQNEQNRISP